MEPIDWLLLLLAENPAPLDPVRVQKGLFLLAAEAPLPVQDAYTFVPYNYGPMSPAIYRDTRVLCRAGLARSHAQPGHRWSSVTVTPSGSERAPLLLARARRDLPRAVEHLGRVRRLVDQLGFEALLEHVYDRHPAYASRSVFRRP